MNNKGAMPVPYIVAIVIAIIVIGILAYIFIVQSHKFGPEAQRYKCFSYAQMYCLTAATYGYDKGKDESNPNFNQFSKEYPMCAGMGFANALDNAYGDSTQLQLVCNNLEKFFKGATPGQTPS